MSDLLEILFQHSSEVICVLDRDHKINMLSSAWNKTLGYDTSDCIHHSFGDFVHPDDHLFLNFALQATQDLLTTDSHKSVGLRLNTRQQQYIWLNWQIHYRPEQKNFILLGSFLKDIVQPDSSEDKAKDFLYRLIDSIPFAIFSKDYRSGEGVYVAWNKTAEDFWGIPRSKILGKTDKDLFDPNLADKLRQQDLQALGSKKPKYLEKVQFLSPYFGSSWMRTWTVPMQNSKGAPFSILSICQDITEWAELEDQVTQQRAIAIHASKMASLGEMASGIAHEVNNPLTIINVNAEKIKKYIHEEQVDRKKIEEDAIKIQATVERIASIVRSLREFSQDFEDEPAFEVSVKSLVAQTLALCESKFSNQNIKIINNVTDSLGAYVNKSQIAECLFNIILNARDAVADLKEKWVQIDAQDTGKAVRIAITDSGTGISEEVAERMMEPLFTTKMVGKGTGLGLSVAKGLIEKNNGRLNYCLKDGHTCFEIILPKLKVSEQMDQTLLSQPK